MTNLMIPLSNEQLMRQAPSIFATQPIDKVSARYKSFQQHRFLIHFAPKVGFL